jgi:hypothetical protein
MDVLLDQRPSLLTLRHRLLDFVRVIHRYYAAVRLLGYPMAEAFEHEITTLYEAREQEHEARRLQSSLSPRRGPRLSNLSLERFRSSTKYHDRPAAADIAFCVAAFANGMTEDRIGCALEDDYLSRDPSPSKRAAYIRRTMEKARRWAER